MTSYDFLSTILLFITLFSYKTIIDNDYRSKLTKEEKDETCKANKMVEEAFPITTKILLILIAVISFSILYHVLNRLLITSYVDSFLSTRSIFIHIIATIIVDVFLLLPFFKERPNASPQLLRIKPRLFQSFIITMFLYSLLICILLIPIVNKTFDSSKPTEEIATISSKDKKTSRKYPSKFYLYFSQTFHDVDYIEVTVDEFKEVNEGDQIKIQIADGLFGLKYKTGTIQAIKKEDESTK